MTEQEAIATWWASECLAAGMPGSGPWQRRNGRERLPQEASAKSWKNPLGKRAGPRTWGLSHLSTSSIPHKEGPGQVQGHRQEKEKIGGSRTREIFCFRDVKRMGGSGGAKKTDSLHRIPAAPSPDAPSGKWTLSSRRLPGFRAGHDLPSRGAAT